MDWEHANISNDFNPGLTEPETPEQSYHILISDGEVLCVDGQHPWRPLTGDEFQWCGLDAVSSHYLGDLSGTPIYAVEIDSDTDEPSGYGFQSLWSFLTGVAQPVFYLIGRAKQVIEWHQHHNFCGSCGQVTSTTPLDRSRKCESCNIFFYPRLSPSIIVLINKGDEILLAKNAHARGNFYSTLAGFVEPGESIEETVHREVFEEVGLQVKNLKYYSSQSWPFPNSLMLGFHAEYDSGELVLQEEEIADAQWFHYNNLPHKPAMMSISGWLINDFIKRMD
ncbi:NAD(+) diphosphatase [Gammaproteobacteria bacterium]|nr:NAD(+) diphosphatase [Gammaproteobacteria bacterium]